MLEFASIDGVTLEDKSQNLDIMVTNVTGITGMPTIRGEVYDRAENDGVVEPDFQFFGARVSAWDIMQTGSSEADCRQKWTTLSRTLVGAMRQQKLLVWRTIGDTLTLQSAVRVAGMTQPIYGRETVGDYVAFQVLFRAADPNNYDSVASAVATGAPSFNVVGIPFPIPFPVPWALVGSGAGTVAMTNNGDTDGWPIITITGPITNPIIQNQTRGQSIYIDGLSMTTGDTLIINNNPASRSVEMNGVNQFGLVRFSDSDFFPVTAGATESITFSGTGTDDTYTTMTVSLRSAYII